MRYLLFLLAVPLAAESGWWTAQPIRWLQTNLREPDAAVDPRKLVDDAARFHANVLHINVGGIVAFYPTQVPFHFRSPALRGDLIGEVVRLAHARGIKVVGRFDLSKTPKATFDAHPEWFFRQANGEPVIFNDLYSTCINSEWYRVHAMKILAEALERYELDGLFFNMFGNQSTDYAGRFVGHCHCESCRRLYREANGLELPKEPGAAYRQFMFDSSRRVARAIGDLIRAKRPQAGFFNYIQEHTDGIMSESNTAIGRALPLWPYASSDNVNRARNSEPAKASVNLCMEFVDFPWRWAMVSPAEIRLRLWQNVAHGGAAAFAVNGTLDQQDPSAIEAARPVFAWLAANERYFVGQESAARVLLLHGPARTGQSYSQSSYRGLFRLLSEEHIPFAVAQNLNGVGKRDFDLVIATDWAPAELDRLPVPVLVVHPKPPEFPIAPVVRTQRDVKGYLRVRDPGWFPSLGSIRLLMLNSDFTETEATGPLTLVPPSIIGPPEKIHTDVRDTAIPGLVVNEKRAWLPWDLGTMYHRLSLESHRSFFRDVVNQLHINSLRTNAHPLVEMVWMRQDGQTLLHLINLSGHSGTAYFDPLPQTDIEITLPGSFRTARALRLERDLPLRNGTLRLPLLRDYELIVLR